MSEIGKKKQVPRTVLVFGAAKRVGRALVRHLQYKAPGIGLRLASTTDAGVRSLSEEFPGATCVRADYNDPQTLKSAVEGMEGIFVVTPSVFDEEAGMKNLVNAVLDAGTATHIVRLVGFAPGSTETDFPDDIAHFGAAKHFVARRVLDAAKLPVTYLNVASTFTDNYLQQARLVREQRKFVYPNRLIPHIDSRDAGEVAAELLLSPDERQIHQLYSITNGQDVIDTYEAAAMLSDVLKVKLEVDTSQEAYQELLAPMFEGRWADPAAGMRAMMSYFEFEAGGAAFLSVSDCAERILGRKPLSVYGWFREHKHHFESPAK
ncbi:NmrA family NAD(P)-binding protein [Streptomyces sp. YKOK-I1]